MKELDVLLVKADFTNKSDIIRDDLRRFDRYNIPVNIIVPSDPNQPYILTPEVFGPKKAIKILEKAAGSGDLAKVNN